MQHVVMQDTNTLIASVRKNRTNLMNLPLHDYQVMAFHSNYIRVDVE